MTSLGNTLDAVARALKGSALGHAATSLDRGVNAAGSHVARQVARECLNLGGYQGIAASTVTTKLPLSQQQKACTTAALPTSTANYSAEMMTHLKTLMDLSYLQVLPDGTERAVIGGDERSPFIKMPVICRVVIPVPASGLETTLELLNPQRKELTSALPDKLQNERAVMNVLDSTGTPMRALLIAKAVFGEDGTRAMVNPLLYDMEKRGLVEYDRLDKLWTAKMTMVDWFHHHAVQEDFSDGELDGMSVLDDVRAAREGDPAARDNLLAGGLGFVAETVMSEVNDTMTLTQRGRAERRAALAAAETVNEMHEKIAHQGVRSDLSSLYNCLLPSTHCLLPFRACADKARQLSDCLSTCTKQCMKVLVVNAANVRSTLYMDLVLDAKAIHDLESLVNGTRNRGPEAKAPSYHGMRFANVIPEVTEATLGQRSYYGAAVNMVGAAMMMNSHTGSAKFYTRLTGHSHIVTPAVRNQAAQILREVEETQGLLDQLGRTECRYPTVMPTVDIKGLSPEYSATVDEDAIAELFEARQSRGECNAIPAGISLLAAQPPLDHKHPLTQMSAVVRHLCDANYEIGYEGIFNALHNHFKTSKKTLPDTYFKAFDHFEEACLKAVEKLPKPEAGWFADVETMSSDKVTEAHLHEMFDTFKPVNGLGHNEFIEADLTLPQL